MARKPAAGGGRRRVYARLWLALLTGALVTAVAVPLAFGSRASGVDGGVDPVMPDTTGTGAPAPTSPPPASSPSPSASSSVPSGGSSSSSGAGAGAGARSAATGSSPSSATATSNGGSAGQAAGPGSDQKAGRHHGKNKHAAKPADATLPATPAIPTPASAVTDGGQGGGFPILWLLLAVSAIGAAALAYSRGWTSRLAPAMAGIPAGERSRPDEESDADAAGPGSRLARLLKLTGDPAGSADKAGNITAAARKKAADTNGDELEDAEAAEADDDAPDASTAGLSPSQRRRRRRRRAQMRRVHEQRNSEEFSSEKMLTPEPGAAPKRGIRERLSQLTGGALLSPGRSEELENELIARATTPMNGRGTRRIAVISRKGGVGKTTTTLMLGHTFAQLRGDRVVALDGNPDAGSLGYRVPRQSDKDVISLLADRDSLTRYADIRAYTNQAQTGLEVIAASNDPKITDALGEEDFRHIAELLEVHYNLICMDTGTGVLESANRGILALADQVVVVMGASLDSGRTAASTLDWLEQNGHEDLVRDSVAVINSVRRENLVDLEQLEEHFRARCREVVRIPFDSQLAAGAEAGPDQLSDSTRRAYLELAAAVGADFSHD